MNKLSSIGIIGGGIMGIDIARQLSRKGFKVTVLEEATELGGLTSSAKFKNFTWDCFYHVILPNDVYTINMVEELGLKEELRWGETKTGFFIDGSYHSMSSTIEFFKFPSLNIIDKLRLGVTILISAHFTKYKRLETIPVTKWLNRWSGNNTFNKIWLPLLKAKLGEDYKNTSAAFICATIKRLYGARKNGAKKEIFGYVRGGYSRILEAIIKKILSENIEIVTNFKVTEINKTFDNNLKVTSHNGQEMIFEYMISTLPSFMVASMCPDLDEPEIEKLKRTTYLGVVCMSLLLKKPLTPYYITNVADKKINLTGVIEMTSLVYPSFWGGNSLVYLPKYIRSDNKLFDLSDQEIEDNLLSSLKIMHPSLKDEDIVNCQLSKAKYVMALPELGFSNHLPSFKTSVKNLFIINSSFIIDGILNVNETLKTSASYSTQVISTILNEK